MVNTVHYTKFRQNRIKIAKNLGKAVPGFWIGGPLSKILEIFEILEILETRKCPLRGHCLAPPGGPGGLKSQEVIPKFFLMHIFHS